MENNLDLVNPKISLNLDTNFLKIVALFSMLIDHFGKIFAPNIILFPIIGRLAFPIFAYCIVVGCLYTTSSKKYLQRTLTFFVISQPFYALVWSTEPGQFFEKLVVPNIFLDLSIYIVIISGIINKNWIISTAGVFLGSVINTEYGLYGILLVVLFYIFRDSKILSIISIALYLSSSFLNGNDLFILGYGLNVQGFAILCLPFIYINTNVNPKINKYFFYIAYTVHLLIILILKFIFIW